MTVIRKIKDLEGLNNDRGLFIHTLGKSIDVCMDEKMLFGFSLNEELTLKKAVQVLNRMNFDIYYAESKRFCLEEFLEENFYCDYNKDNEYGQYLIRKEREDKKWELAENGFYSIIPYVVYVELKPDKDENEVMESLNEHYITVSDMEYAFKELGWK